MWCHFAYTYICNITNIYVAYILYIHMYIYMYACIYTTHIILLYIHVYTLVVSLRYCYLVHLFECLRYSFLFCALLFWFVFVIVLFYMYMLLLLLLLLYIVGVCYVCMQACIACKQWAINVYNTTMFTYTVHILLIRDEERRMASMVYFAHSRT